MARLFHDGFDRLTPAQMQTTGRWQTVGAGVLSTTGRTDSGLTGTSGATTADNQIRTRALNPLTPNKGYHGIAVQCTSIPASEQALWAVLDGAGTTLATVAIKPDGTVTAYRGTLSGGTLLGTSASAFVAASAWRYIQIGFDWDADVLQVLSTISGGATSLLLVAPGLTSPAPWSVVDLFVSDEVILDDFYVNDGAPVGAFYFSGDTAIQTIDPASVQFHTYYFPWTPNSGSDLVAPVDETTLDNDSSYLYTRDSYSTLLFAMDQLTDDGRTVDALQATAVARQVSSTWAPSLAVEMKTWDGVLMELADAPIGSQLYTAKMGINIRHDLTIARVNTAQFGVRS